MSRVQHSFIAGFLLAGGMAEIAFIHAYLWGIATVFFSGLNLLCMSACKTIEPKEAKTVGAIYCKLCDEVVVSHTRHDFRQCKGKHVFIDGGKDYVRYGTLIAGVKESDYVVSEEPK